MDCRIEEKDSFFIIGFSKRVRLQFEGENKEIGKLAARVTPDIAEKLKSLNDEQPDGILNVSANGSSCLCLGRIHGQGSLPCGAAAGLG